jgi:hypothetical protein
VLVLADPSERFSGAYTESILVTPAFVGAHRAPERNDFVLQG